MSLTLPFRPLSNYAAANWPLVWKLKLHVCVLYSLLGIGFGLVLWLATSTVLEVDKQMSTGLQSSIGVLFVIILTIPIVVWIRATRHAPLLRSIPSDRFSPRFTFVILGVIAIWGGFLVITDYVGVKSIYFPTIDQNAFIDDHVLHSVLYRGRRDPQRLVFARDDVHGLSVLSRDLPRYGNIGEIGGRIRRRYQRHARRSHQISR